MITCTKTGLNFERELLSAPFGFKGGFLSEIWQVVARLESASGRQGIGLGGQSVLWSDPRVFAAHSQAGGNSLMLLLTEKGLQIVRDSPFTHPIELLDRLLPAVLEYGRQITGQPDLRTTFALNALVAVDNAAWLLYAAENGITQFDALIPPDVRPALSHRHREIFSVPAVGYGTSIEEITRLVNAGYSILKIKIGSDPQKDGDPEKMLDWDCKRMAAIHNAVGQRLVADRPVQYYLDANGRYDSKARLLSLLDTLGSMGALPQTLLLEEPFPEEVKEDVRDLPVRVVADESAHTDTDAAERIALGYGAIALKPVAKTLSMSFKIAQVAHEHGVPCFCADLTVNPILLEWNRAIAARLAPLPGLNAGLQEANGFQNYKNWDEMQTWHPCANAAWTQASQGVFTLDADYYAQSGGLFLPDAHYSCLVA